VLLLAELLLLLESSLVPDDVLEERLLVVLLFDDSALDDEFEELCEVSSSPDPESEVEGGEVESSELRDDVEGLFGTISC
jgi:hypothetical protein